MTRYIDTVEVAKIIRTTLKAKFPGVKFSVKSDRYAGGSSINVNYTDGPAETAVEEAIGRFHGSTFDGMQDLKESHDSDLNGEIVRFANDYLFITRQYSQAFCEGVKAFLLADMPGYYVNEEDNAQGFKNDGYIKIEGSEYFGYRCDCWGNNERWRLNRLMNETNAEQAAAWLTGTPAPTEPTAAPVVAEPARSAELTSKPATEAAPAATEPAVEVAYTVSHNREWTWITFTGKPSEATRAALAETFGARWSSKRVAWYITRPVTEAEIAAAIAPAPVVEEAPEAPVAVVEPTPADDNADLNAVIADYHARSAAAPAPAMSDADALDLDAAAARERHLAAHANGTADYTGCEFANGDQYAGWHEVEDGVVWFGAVDANGNEYQTQEQPQNAQDGQNGAAGTNTPDAPENTPSATPSELGEALSAINAGPFALLLKVRELNAERAAADAPAADEWTQPERGVYISADGLRKCGKNYKRAGLWFAYARPTVDADWQESPDPWGSLHAAKSECGRMIAKFAPVYA